ncbi:hypothetical protein ACS0TY_013415 [Phlomoides rotata]
MLVKQWLEERKFYQGEIQHLKDKMAVAERAAKAEAQFKKEVIILRKVCHEKDQSINDKDDAIKAW